MAKSLQQIEDFYTSQGFKGEELRQALEIDTEYQKLLIQRKSTIRNKYGISEKEEAEFLLPTEEDYKILSMIHELEKLRLSEENRKVVELIKTQLLDDWRSPLIKKLVEIKGKYSR